MAGKHLELFLVDGTPGGLTTAEILNWTGHVLAASRSDMAALLSRDEVVGTCVYLLVGIDEDGASRCYIGETDDFASRLKQHSKLKTFWDRVIVVTSKDSNLTKAHGRYLESRLIGLAAKAGRVELDNGTLPPIPKLPESHESDMDYFLDQLQIVLPMLGVDAIRAVDPAPTPGSPAARRVSPVFRLRNAKNGVDARAQQIDGEFTMLAGSTIVAEWKAAGRAESTRRAYASYRAHHQRLRSDGSIEVSGVTGALQRDVAFGSPSQAGAIALGRSCNGRTSWILSDGRTFGEWESRGVD